MVFPVGVAVFILSVIAAQGAGHSFAVAASVCAIVVAMCRLVLNCFGRDTETPERINFVQQYGFQRGIKRHWFSRAVFPEKISRGMIGMRDYIIIPAAALAGVLFLFPPTATLVFENDAVRLGYFIAFSYTAMLQSVPLFIFSLAIYYNILSVVLLGRDCCCCCCCGPREATQTAAYNELYHALIQYQTFSSAAHLAALRHAAAQWEAVDTPLLAETVALQPVWFTFARLVNSQAQAILSHAEFLASQPQVEIEVIQDDGHVQTLQVVLAMTVTEAAKAATAAEGEAERDFRVMCDEPKWHFGGRETADPGSVTLADLGIEDGATVR